MYSTYVIIIAKEREMKNLPVQGSEVEDGGLLWIPLFLLSFSFPLILSFLLLSLCAIFFGLYFCFLSVSLCVWLSLCVLSPFRFCVLFVRPSVFFFFLILCCSLLAWYRSLVFSVSLPFLCFCFFLVFCFGFYCDLLLECFVSGAAAAEGGALELLLNTKSRACCRNTTVSPFVFHFCLFVPLWFFTSSLCFRSSLSCSSLWFFSPRPFLFAPPGFSLVFLFSLSPGFLSSFLFCGLSALSSCQSTFVPVWGKTGD